MPWSDSHGVCDFGGGSAADVPLDMLTSFAQNRCIARHQSRASAALAFGRRLLDVHRNPVMAAGALSELTERMREGEGPVTSGIVRDVFAFVAVPHFQELGLTFR